MSRKDARAVALKLIYEYSFLGEKNDLTLNRLLTEDFGSEDEGFVKSLYEGVLSRYQELKDIVDKYSVGFRVERIYNIDLAILLIAIYELQQGDVPAGVVVNEAVELSKVYSTDKSYSFINGILAAYLKEHA